LEPRESFGPLLFEFSKPMKYICVALTLMAVTPLAASGGILYPIDEEGHITCLPKGPGGQIFIFVTPDEIAEKCMPLQITIAPPDNHSWYDPETGAITRQAPEVTR
jgi:hypothetical protein